MAKKDKNIETIHERIALCVEFFGKGRNTIFAEKIGISEGNIRGYIKGVQPKADVLEKIVRNYEVSPEWLLTGEGDMVRTSLSTPIQSHHGQLRETFKLGEGIPLIPIDAVAGIPVVDNKGVNFADCPHYIVPEFSQRGAQFLIRVNGDSMAPTYNSGDILACKKVEEIRFIQWGKVYVIDSSQDQLVKRPFECQEDTDCIICKSDNASYPPFLLPKSDIRSMSIVIGLIRIE